MLLGLSQQSLGDEVGVSVQQIQKYERAHNRISSGKLYHFSNFLGVSIDYFFDGIKQKTEPHIFADGVDVGLNTTFQLQLATSDFLIENDNGILKDIGGVRFRT